jgi:prephenate dehydrogenase
MARFERLAVVGVGLIGGSAALALRRAGAVRHVVGVGRGRANLERALSLGVLDEICLEPAEGVRDADAVLVATPVGQFPALFAAIAPALAPGAFVTDGGSTKQDVVAAARAGLGAALPRFVPAHPIAGAEASGVEAARADLFEGRNVVLTPLAETDAACADRAEALWSACGARVSRMAPAEHDAVFAAVSHLPHLLAYALVAMIAQRPDAARLFGFAAGGFRDFTRIASSSPEMWRDIFVANSGAVMAEIDRYQAALEGLRAMVASRDGQALEALLAQARDARESWIRGGDR